MQMRSLFLLTGNANDVYYALCQICVFVKPFNIAFSLGFLEGFLCFTCFSILAGKPIYAADSLVCLHLGRRFKTKTSFSKLQARGTRVYAIF